MAGNERFKNGLNNAIQFDAYSVSSRSTSDFSSFNSSSFVNLSFPGGRLCPFSSTNKH